MKRIIVAFSVFITFSANASDSFPLIVEPAAGLIYLSEGEPSLSISSSSNLGTKEAKIAAIIDKAAAEEWCDAFRPGNEDCLKNTMTATAMEASADCFKGKLTDFYGNHYTFNSNSRDDKNFYIFKDRDNKDFPYSQALNLQWMKLCPSGRPYDDQPCSIDFSVKDSDIPYQSDVVGIDKDGTEDTATLSISENSLWLNNKLILRGIYTFTDNSSGASDTEFKGIYINEKDGCQSVGTNAVSETNKNIITIKTKKAVFKADSCDVEKLTDYSFNYEYLE